MTEDRLQTLLHSEPYWTARAMREQGSRFYRALGEALEAADLANRRRIYEGWTAELWDFYQRGLRLEEAERASGAG
ncbi:hypothetical protein E5F05_12760 [Deinococcus metallilatus]|uniref:Uncharacterized protein n=1 Tax=Deinococcus metallilatus TaxID=1211322 RepID=A0AAJ5K4X7_9DEIO|nr:hypothetical protein [Deinococcus metallilatus]MBB5295091.1 hypothetical protein [Deinococcus metallilatus]QBY08730.1 hypothetical protein E5F05_12760 [Deinococcus metallilatus]RXJ10609.1 hypothetical protein ERJ73_11590 [Deinococcus metallilatus]TLK26580.1 hypothetical protein FCS05_11340 [Deinococcus metallilatus]